MKKLFTASILILTIFLSTIITMDYRVRADPFPPPTTEIKIENPQNISYSTNTINLIFSAYSISFFPQLHFYYSLDGEERKPFENVTIVTQESIPINPGIYMKNVTGNYILNNLSEGSHNVTVYEISHVNDDPQNEEIVYSANVHFNIETPSEHFPILSAFAAVLTVVSVIVAAIVVYVKKRKGKVG